MNAQATKLEGAENDLKQLMADVTRVMEKAQEAVARIAPKVATPITEAESMSFRRARTRHHDSLSFGNWTIRSVVMSCASTSSPAAKSGHRGASSAASKVKGSVAASAVVDRFAPMSCKLSHDRFDQYSSASMIVITRSVTDGSAGSGECIDSLRS